MPRRQTTHPLLTALGARVRDLRLDRKMSLANLAETSGVGKGALSSIENGRVNVTIETCVRIAAGLGIGVEDMIPRGFEHSNSNTSAPAPR